MRFRILYRVVAKGFSQVEGIDYHETFSPTVHMTSVRMATQVMAEEDMHVHQMDFHCAFLNSDLDKVIYMEPPPGYTKDRSKVCKLKKKSLWSEAVRLSMELHAY